MNGDPAVNWAGALFLVLPISVVTTVVVSLFLRQLYSDRVGVHMGRSVELRPPDDEPPAGPEVELLEYDSLPDLSPEAERLYRRATRTPRRAAIVFALAGVAHACVATLVLFTLTRTEFLPGRTLVTIFALTWPVLPTVVVVALADRRLQLVLPGVFIIAVLVLSGPYRYAISMIWLIQMFTPTFAMFLVANWWMRAIGPVVLVFTSVLFMGLMLSPFAAYYTAHNVMRLDSGRLILTLAFFFAALFTAVACVFVWLTAWRYRRKRQSSQLMLLNLFWLLVTEWQCLLLAPRAGVWAAAGVFAYVTYRLVLWVGLRPFQRAAEGHRNARLLLLRVFGPPAPGERSLEELGLRWRYVGSIQLIAGKDLAIANLEPHELLDFVMGGLKTHFVKDRSELEKKLSEVDVRPDPDGRFRVNEFFCDASIWQEALLELVGKNEVKADGRNDRRNDVVLMDLRGFKKDNRGVTFELTQLINVKPMRETVMIIDSKTNKEFLRKVLSAALARASTQTQNPNPPAAIVRVLRVEEQNAREARRILRLLCAAAASEA